MHRLAALLVLVGCAGPNEGFDVPDDYRLVYAQDFSHQGSLTDFEFTDGSAWKWGMGNPSSEAPRTYLELTASSDYAPPWRSPLSIAWIADVTVGDFVLQVEARQIGREYGHRDLCFFFAGNDADHFYYVHLATTPDDHANNVFLVDGADRRRVAEVPAQGTDWTGGWHQVRVERTIDDGRIRVFFDDMTVPVLEAVDKTLGLGRIGLGSFDDTGRFTSLLLWSPDE